VECRDFMDVGKRSFWRDVGWVGLLSLILFGFAGFSGRPLTMHEARLPQTSREMMWNDQWLLPTSGGRPWLERPPLPHWLVIAAMKITGRDDRVWVVRLPSAIMGTITVLLTLFIANRLFGRTVGLVAGCVLALSYKFYQYSTLAEDDIFLAMFVALAAAFFTQAELVPHHRVKWFGFVSNRSWLIWMFFFVLGVSNLTKGPLLGIVILGGPVGIYLLVISAMEGNFQPLLRYVWLWGWILLAGLTLAWPWWANHQVPDVVENWKYDYLGRISGAYTAINEPWYYYFPKLFLGLLPWAPICLFALVQALLIIFSSLLPMWIHPAEPDVVELPSLSVNGPVLGYFPVNKRLNRWQQFVSAFMPVVTEQVHPIGYIWIVCWGVVPLLVLSIPHGKHDHYLVPFLAPWAILGALGLVDIGRRIHAGRKTFLVIIVLLAVGFCIGEARFAAPTDHTLDDTAFLQRCQNEVPSTAALFIDGKTGPVGNLDFFRIQFYSRPDAILLHNLSFLRNDKITTPVVYVICRQQDNRLLQQLGTTTLIDQSKNSHEDSGKPGGRFSLFRLTFNPHLQRYPLPDKITSLQAMERAPGPWCGPELK
jgi:4-amino-4-deoxy-L-arabinose transferase-like glycosyltransferase